MCEWHYSGIDRPFFMKNELQELLDSSGLGQVTHLTRGEWSVVRSAFGKPRRLSLAFLKQERARLELYRGLHDGIILTIKANKYRVQFNSFIDMLDEVGSAGDSGSAGALDRKEQLLAKLRTMNSTAESGAHVDPSSLRPSEAFQASYATVLTSLQAVNAEVQALMARLQTRSHLSASPAAAAAATAQGKGMDSSSQRIRAQQQLDPAEMRTSAAAADVQQLDGVITGCISMLIMVHKLTGPDVGSAGGGLGAFKQQSAAVVDAALEAALKQLEPKVASNSQEFEHISRSVGLLKSQLAKAH
eukprot:gene8012-8210_t